MKNKITTLFFVILTVNSISQLRSKLDLLELAPIAAYKYTPYIVNGIDSTEIHTLTIGISLADGEVESTSNWGILSLSGNWKYFAAPFISLDYNIASNAGPNELFKANDGASPLVLNIGVTAAYGGYFLIIPMGVNGTAGFSTDFKDFYLKYGIAYDVVGFSIGVGGLINVTNNNDSFYKSKKGVELRCIWNWN
ncbi:hypothetical protein N9544_00785 [Flavobacteriales bacterium]|nr:hypothetical protein [Flavobacteriales bacterium]